MLLLLSGLVCVCLCSGAAQLHSRETKATFSTPEAAGWKAQSRGWFSVTGEDSGRLQSATRSAAQSVRIKLVNEAGDQRSPQEPRPGHASPKPRRAERSDPLAQEQEDGPPNGPNISDYGKEEPDYAAPDDPAPTPLLPLDPRTRRKPVKNPFYPLSAEAVGAYALMLVSAVIFGVGVIANMSVMCIVCHNFYMRSISNSLLASLALWDFSVLFLCLPLVLFHQLTSTWLLGQLSCRIVPYVEVASLGVTTFTLCALCIDRFRAATNVQLYYELTENWASTATKLAVIWVGAMLLALPELLLHQLVPDQGEAGQVGGAERCVIRVSTQLPDWLYVLGLTYDSARLWWCFGCYFCLPTLFTILSSLLTARRIRGAQRGHGHTSRKQLQLESQMNCVVVALAILYGFCVVPENICNMAGTYMAASVARRTLDVLQLLSQLLLFCKSAAAPVLLLSLSEPFSHAYLACCCCCCQECNPQPGPAPTAADQCLELLPLGAAASDTAAVATHC